MIFDVIGIVGIGLIVYCKWFDVISDNIVNINIVSCIDDVVFCVRYILVQMSDQLFGVYVVGIVQGSVEGWFVYQLDYLFVDVDGYVCYLDIDLGDQMSQFIFVQCGYQVSVVIVDCVCNFYEVVLQIGCS